MQARHDVDRCADGEPEMRDHHRVARAAVIRRQQDAVPRLDRRLQPVDAQQFVRFDPMARSEERWQDESAQQPGPEGAVVRRHEHVGFIDDDVLHAGREPARSLRCSRRGCQTANGQLRRIAQDEAAWKTHSQHRNRAFESLSPNVAPDRIILLETVVDDAAIDAVSRILLGAITVVVSITAVACQQNYHFETMARYEAARSRYELSVHATGIVRAGDDLSARSQADVTIAPLGA